MHEAVLWETEGDRVRCNVCPHRCAIAADRLGVCGVRKNVDGALFALTYGKVSSVAVDPIEKKPVFHYRPGTLALSLGSVGCNMKCLHCQNWQISRAEPGDGSLRDLPPADVVPIAREQGCAGVAFTYNEPVIWIEYVLDTAAACKAAGLYTVMVTNGYVTAEALDRFGDVIDVWRVDIKGFDDETYRELCRVPSVGPVLEGAIRARRSLGMHVEVVTNVVPGMNDDERTLEGIASWINHELGADTPWHVTRFFPYLELSEVPPTPIEGLRRAVEIGREAGLEHVFLGNVSEPGGEDTVCPGCGRIVIRRRGYDVVSDEVRDGACAHCGAAVGVRG
jgi:pyruvate formate lyase activating enzyme